MYDFVAIVTIGLEEIAGKEIENLLNTSFETNKGRVNFTSSLEAIFKVNSYSRTINKLILVLGSTNFEKLQDLYDFSRYLSYVNFIERDQSIAVRVERYGKHDFTSIEAAARIGQGIIDSYFEETGKRLKVNLNEPDIEIFSRIFENEAIIGLNTTGISLHRRGYRKFNHPAALNPAIASAMIYISNWNIKETFLDPMCGGATIAIEAALMARNFPICFFRENSKLSYAFKKFSFIDIKEYEKFLNESLKKIDKIALNIFASDASRKYIKGASINIKNALVNDTIDLLVSDARKIDFLRDIDVVITNPPYGKRSANIFYVKELYSSFLKELKNKAKRAVLITAAPNMMRNVAVKEGIEIEDEIATIHGDLPVRIFKFNLS